MKQVIGYPNFEAYIPSEKYDLDKWVKTFREINIKTRLGSNRQDAIKSLINNWSDMEKFDFSNWMKYYESGDQLKYKKAQFNYINSDIGYFLPNPKQAPIDPRSIDEQASSVDTDAETFVRQQPPPAMSKEDKKKIIEEHRRKILGRLHSVEKLLSTQEGHVFAGEEFEKLLNAIYDLKKQIQTTNKIALSSQTIIDLIIRQSNILDHKGYKDASKFLVKFAQNTPGDMSFNLGVVPSGGSQPQGQGNIGNNPIDPTKPVPPGLEEKPEDPGAALGEFMENLDTSGLTEFDKKDQSKADDGSEYNHKLVRAVAEEMTDRSGDNWVQLVNNREFADIASSFNTAKEACDYLDDNSYDLHSFIDDVEIDSDNVSMDNDASDGELVVEAQLAPDAPTELPDPAAVAPPKDIPMPKEKAPAGKVPSDPNALPAEKKTDGKDYDALIDMAFENITVEDVINKLNQVASMFRTREFSRQLAIADLMLSRLKLSPFFGMLGEAQNKALDASNYCLIRVDDAISKLQGAVAAPAITDVEHGKETPETMKIKQNLQKDQDNDEKRKQLKKKVQDQELASAMKPELEVENVPGELSEEPAKVEAPEVVSPAPAPTPKR